MKAFTLCFLLMSCTLTLAQKKPTFKLKRQLPRLHVIFAMEPKGVEYGRLNMENDSLMTEFVKTVQRGLEYPMQIRRLDEKHFTRKALQDTIAALKTTPDDIVILYYSGYGISSPDTTKKFANWRLHEDNGIRQSFFSNWNSHDEKEKGLSVREVESWLGDKNKHPHLALLIADCTTEQIKQLYPLPMTLGTVDLTREIIKQLFIKHTGIVKLGSSASVAPGYINTIGSVPGTIFTNGLQAGFSYMLDYTDPSDLPNISFEDLRSLTESYMSEKLAMGNYRQVPVLEMKNWNGTPANPEHKAAAATTPINARWQGFIVNERDYEQLAQKKLDLSIRQLPAQTDLANYAPPVLNQGNKGNCVAISIGYYMRSIMEAIRWNLTQKDVILKRSFSPFYLYSALKQDNDLNCTFGIDAGQALQFLKDVGLPRFSDLPDLNYCGNDSGVSIDPNSRILDYVKLFSISDPKASKVMAVKQTLADMSPVVVGIQTTSSLQNLAFTKTLGTRLKASLWELKSFVTKSATDKDRSKLDLSWEAYDANALAFGHALCVVGYDDNILGKGKGAFKLINSWGSSWGNNGYFWMSYKEFGKFAKYGYQAYLNESGSPVRLNTDLTITIGSLRKEPKFTLMPSDTGLVTYTLTQPQHTGTSLKFRIDVKKQTYLYLITASSSDTVVTLQLPKQGKQTVIAPGSRMYYPSEYKSLTLKGNPGVEYMLFLFSDSEITDIQDYLMTINNRENSFPQGVRQAFGRRLIPNRRILYKPKKMGFFLPQNNLISGRIVPLLVTINHIL